MKSVRDSQMKFLFLLVCFLVVCPCYVWAEDSGNHYGWDKYPGPNTVATGGVIIGGVEVPFSIDVLTKDWVRTQVSDTEAYYTWTLTNYDIMNGTEIVATIDSLQFVTDFDPYVKLNFIVSAGAADTTFTLNSSVVSFPTMSNPLAYASASLTVTDVEGGGTMTGLYSGSKNYAAIYNGSSTFANLVSTFSCPEYGQSDSNERTPPLSPNWQTISGNVSNIQSQLNFTLTADDSASGTTIFQVKVPEPATICLLGLGGLALLRRKS